MKERNNHGKACKLQESKLQSKSSEACSCNEVYQGYECSNRQESGKESNAETWPESETQSCTYTGDKLAEGYMVQFQQEDRNCQQIRCDQSEEKR